MKKKVLLVTLLVAAIVASCFAFTACNKDKGDGDKGVKVAMITDYGDITDQSFNQTTYEACKAYCDANNIKFKYYKPTGNSTEARVASVNAAIAEGYTIIVMPGYAFGGTIVEAAPLYPDVKFIALDVAKGDLLEAGVAQVVLQQRQRLAVALRRVLGDEGTVCLGCLRILPFGIERIGVCKGGLFLVRPGDRTSLIYILRIGLRRYRAENKER